MKSVILSAAMLLTLLSCNKKNTEADTTGTAVQTINAEAPGAAVARFACAMHPEVVGKEGDKCPKCEMLLTEPVTPEATDPESDSISK